MAIAPVKTRPTVLVAAMQDEDPVLTLRRDILTNTRNLYLRAIAASHRSITRPETATDIHSHPPQE